MGGGRIDWEKGNYPFRGREAFEIAATVNITIFQRMLKSQSALEFSRSRSGGRYASTGYFLIHRIEGEKGTLTKLYFADSVTHRQLFSRIQKNEKR